MVVARVVAAAMPARVLGHNSPHRTGRSLRQDQLVVGHVRAGLSSSRVRVFLGDVVLDDVLAARTYNSTPSFIQIYILLHLRLNVYDNLEEHITVSSILHSNEGFIMPYILGRRSEEY